MAFLERRWFLLSLAFWLVVAMCVDFVPSKTELSTWTTTSCGLFRGNLIYLSGDPWTVSTKLYTDESFRDGPIMLNSPPTFFGDVLFHRPMPGSPPLLTFSPIFSARLPLWILLSGIIGWIIIRERRWRELRAKTQAASPAS